MRITPRTNGIGNAPLSGLTNQLYQQSLASPTMLKVTPQPSLGQGLSVISAPAPVVHRHDLATVQAIGLGSASITGRNIAQGTMSLPPPLIEGINGIKSGTGQKRATANGSVKQMQLREDQAVVYS